ncbi:MAG: hypothetical protein JOZ15_21810 [Acidobacteria bacterium]|nr:hypothetical protein [Acidobacteriota bacterium]
MPASGAPTASNKKVYTVLSYALGWIGGLIFLFVGKDDPDVKWNAAQSLVLFGGLTVVNIILGFIPVVNLLAVLLWFVGFIYWIIFLVLSLQSQGQRIQAPLIGSFLGNFATQVANAVN